MFTILSGAVSGDVEKTDTDCMGVTKLQRQEWLFFSGSATFIGYRCGTKKYKVLALPWFWYRIYSFSLTQKQKIQVGIAVNMSYWLNSQLFHLLSYSAHRQTSREQNSGWVNLRRKNLLPTAQSSFSAPPSKNRNSISINDLA